MQAFGLVCTFRKEVAVVATVTASHRSPQSRQRQVVFSFDEGTSASLTAKVRGGKGVHLAEMVTLGLPVPPGFTVTTTVGRAFLETGQFPRRLAGQLDRAIARLEHQTGKGFGNPDNPLLVSVRSGAQASMPGMMDTILNVGLNSATVEGLARRSGERFAYDVYRRFLCQYGQVVLGTSAGLYDRALEFARQQLGDIAQEPAVATLRFACDITSQFIAVETKQEIPADPREQLMVALTAVQQSWMSERAAAYRKQQNLPNWWGTAVTVQAMVFGNYNGLSGTGVVFSHNLNTGQPGLFGEFLPQAQGEEVVSGERTPLSLGDMAKWSPLLHTELRGYVLYLAHHFDDIVDVEFTVEDGRLFLLQVRRAKRSALAAATVAVQRVWAGRMTREEAVATVPRSQVRRLACSEFDEAAALQAEMLASGLSASAGVATGRVVTSSRAALAGAKRGEKVVLVTSDTSPDDLPGMLSAVALVTANGGATCHAAVVAREQGIPAVVGADKTTRHLAEGQLVSVDGTRGRVYAGEVPVLRNTLSKEANIFLGWTKRFSAYQPQIRFDTMDKKWDVNVMLNDFYLSDAMANHTNGTPLEDQAATVREAVHTKTAEVFATYIMVAVALELRHTQKYSTWGNHRIKLLSRKYGIPVEGKRPEALAALLPTLKTLSVSEQVEFLRCAVTTFSQREWHRNYGGQAWAMIARAGLQFLTGQWLPSVFADHVFDLQHNSGVIFDKHVMVSECTDRAGLYRQLMVKKDEAEPYHLHARLQPYGSFSPSVADVFVQGRAAGLWSSDHFAPSNPFNTHP